MKTIGLIGGMSWESSIEHYRLIKDRENVHRITYEELCVGTIRPETKARVASIMSRLVEKGAEGIILGCTELGLLVDAGDCRVPLFDTTRAHALAAVEYALQPQGHDPLHA